MQEEQLLTPVKSASAETRLILSPLSVQATPGEKILLAGPWCLNELTVDSLRKAGADYETLQARTLSREAYIQEADLCLSLYDKYLAVLTEELNRLNGTAFSERYWNTLVHRFLYPLVSSVVDKYFLLSGLGKYHSGLKADIVDYKASWVNPHGITGFGGSRIMNWLVFSIVVDKTNVVPSHFVDTSFVRQMLLQAGDGKKDLKSQKKVPSLPVRAVKALKKWMKWAPTVKKALNGELPLSLFRYFKSPVLALGSQYLSRWDLENLLTKAGGTSYFFNGVDWGTDDFSAPDQKLRASINFPDKESPLDLAIQESIRILLPTVYLENFRKVQVKVRKIVPNRKILILNSQNFGGREIIDFFIAHSVEEHHSQQMMICHGGCFGAMEVSLQERIWAKISDIYALWSNAKSYGAECLSVTMPSLRFHNWQGFKRDPSAGDILIFMAGHYPSRYTYNSIYPYTIDDTFDDWQLRFLSNIDSKHLPSVVIRDYHRSADISQGILRAWAEKYKVPITAELPMKQALRKSKIAIQTVPQTTYLETIVADHPTLCYWNPQANMLRTDLEPYYEQLVKAGVLHFSPESAARKLNEIAVDPQVWWQTAEVQKAVQDFKKNVVVTAPDAIDRWGAFIREKCA